MNNDVRKFIKQKQKDGWTLPDVGRSKHHKLIHPSGKFFIFVPSTPSCHRWEMNLERDIRKHEREILNGENQLVGRG